MTTKDDRTMTTPRPSNRYPNERHQTRKYTFFDLEAAWDDALADWAESGRPLMWSPTVTSTREVQLLHATDFWAYWSDGVVTTVFGLKLGPDRPKSLSPDAEGLISEAVGSDSRGFAWRFLAEIEKVVSRVQEWSDPPKPGGYQGKQLERLVVLRRGREETFYVTSEGYFEGYIFEITNSRPAHAGVSEVTA